jgi:VCBS repeat-containing protein
LDQYTPSGVTASTGKIFDNDDVGSLFAQIIVDPDGAGPLGPITIGTTPVELIGTYGKLVLNASGDYSYTPNSNLPHQATPFTDSFDYSIKLPNNETSTATLTVTTYVTDPTTPAPMSGFSMMFDEGGMDSLVDDGSSSAFHYLAANDDQDQMSHAFQV